MPSAGNPHGDVEITHRKTTASGDRVLGGRVRSRSTPDWWHKVAALLEPDGCLHVHCTCRGFRQRGHCAASDHLTKLIREET